MAAHFVEVSQNGVLESSLSVILDAIVVNEPEPIPRRKPKATNKSGKNFNLEIISSFLSFSEFSSTSKIFYRHFISMKQGITANRAIFIVNTLPLENTNVVSPVIVTQKKLCLTLSLHPIQDGVFPVTFTNVGFGLQNFLTFSFNPFATLAQNFEFVPGASPKLLNLNPLKKSDFSSQILIKLTL